MDADKSGEYARRKHLDIMKYGEKINYSPRYADDEWEYRHVTLPRELVKYVPADRLMEEDEWRALGVQQSLGWYTCFALSPTTLMTASSGHLGRARVCVLEMYHVVRGPGDDCHENRQQAMRGDETKWE
ncbi:hypothetical protein AMAG_03584 [Allomyces macrogynus ATCC 38327]|uniref:Cyclin-dependent kinases regulatory subunit n=1 Tax=Allomyces macrogynus (strain ATCC 38327) TaxID=578462 RepID=A0A0L0SA43_ALLM3|nr:hypothetical protein AMAG_03584 [Allomyces macrogynus ATCC 38327]|eukprot:KNE59274.1 hypothetical protein AMAG_03584 [Allomyces macrogynus ATCC 38327]